MLSFASDYLEGAHEAVLEALIRTNREQLPGYGEDRYCKSAADKIRCACHKEEAQVFFLTGGTQTNAIVIASMLKPYEGVIAADTGHISVHEAGAIEASGHKVLTVPGKKGKLRAKDVNALISGFYADESYEHMVFPGMVYISHPTEYGTLYSKSELTELALVCRKYQIPLYIDGARLGYGLASDTTNVDLADIADLADVFYIGGTKVGALCGEAVVFTKGNAPKHFMTMVKQRGALLAKGRLTGIQFDTLFTDDLYLKISRHAIVMAEKLKACLKKNDIPFFLETPTNQQFVVLENQKMEALAKRVGFSCWEKADEDHTVVRLATSWATTEEEIAQLDSILEECGRY